MKYEYSENVLVQDSAAALLHDELGWDVVFAYNQEVLGENGTLGRKDYHEIVLWRYFNQALKKLNPDHRGKANTFVISFISILASDQRREVFHDP